MRAQEVKLYIRYVQGNGKIWELIHPRCKESCDDSPCFLFIDVDSAYKIDKDGESVVGVIPPTEVVSEILKDMGLNFFGHSSHNWTESNQKSHFLINAVIHSSDVAKATIKLLLAINDELEDRGYDFIDLAIESLEPSRAIYFPTIENEGDTYKVFSNFGSGAFSFAPSDEDQYDLLYKDCEEKSPSHRHILTGSKIGYKTIPELRAYLKSGKDGCHPYYTKLCKSLSVKGTTRADYLIDVVADLLEGNNRRYVRNSKVLREDELRRVCELFYGQDDAGFYKDMTNAYNPKRFDYSRMNSGRAK